MRQHRRWLYRIMAISVTGVLLSIVFYVWHFRNSQLSYDTQDWGSFGEYLNLMVSFVNTLIVGYITYLLFELQSQRDSYEAEFIEAEHKPIIIFAVDPMVNRWYAYNVGKGAALNLVIARDGNGNNWNDARKCYSLAPNEKFMIRWFQAAGRIIASYQDIFPNKLYTSICQGDETTFEFIDRSALPPNHWILTLRQNAIRLGP